MRKLGEFFHGPERHDPLQAARRFARRVQLENPPGRRELRFRVATMQDFEQWMLDILSHRLSFMASRLPPGSAEEDGIHGSAIRHNPQTGNNWMLALVHAWSSVADILTFYQERYLQERFYGTARERRVSVYELAQSIGYVPRPAIAGSAHVAFEATDVPGLPKTFRLPAGAELQSRPAAGEVAMRFETEEVLEARAEWNRLGRPGLLVLPQEVRGAAVELCLAGSSTGLAPGAALLVHGVINGASRALLRPLTEVEVLPAEADEIGELAETRTRVAWNRPLAEEVSEASFDPSTVEVFALRQAVSLFGAEAARWLDLPFELRRGIQEAAGQSLLGGILVGDAESWQPINLGLPLDAEPTALAVDEEDTLYVGTRGRGLYRRLGSARSWEPGNRGVQLLEIECLHTDPRLGVLAGTADGNLYRSTDRGEIWAPLSGRSMGARLGGVVGLLGLGGQTGTLAGRRRLDRLPSIPVRALTTVSRGSVTEILLGTDSGFFLSTDLANSWYPQNKGLPGVDSETGESEVAVRGVARAEGDEIFAATSHGVFRSADGGGQWRAASAGLPDHDPELDTAGPVQALAALADRRRRRTLVLAATERGLYRSLDGGASWNAVRKTPAGNTEIAIHAVAALNDSITVTARFFAATEGGLWSSEDDGETFHAVDLSQAVPPDRADRAELTVLAVDERNGRVLTASPDYGFAENEWPKFHLAADHIDLSREVTGLPAGDLDALASWIVLEPTVDEATLNPDAAGLGVYRIRATATVQRRDFGLDARLTRLFVQRDPRFAEAPPLAAYGLRTTRAWVLSEPLALAKIRRIDLEGLRERIFGSLRELQQMDPRRQLVVQIRRSAPGLGFSREPIYVCFPIDQPMSRALSVSEFLNNLMKIDIDLVDEDNPPIPLDPAAIEIRANVVRVSEGTTVRGEILGDGNADLSFQRFTLANPPAYARGPDGAPVSTLRVLVQGDPWTEVDNFITSGPHSRHYTLRRDLAGRTQVVFGDGHRGARLPTGSDNVVADYRTGLTGQEVRARSITLMTQQPLGLSAVVNPLPGLPGMPEEDPEEAFENARRRLRSLGRVVSLEDYADFALSYPGIGKAHVRALGEAIVLTVTGWSLEAAPPRALLDALGRAIRFNRARSVIFHVVAFRECDVHISARILLESRLPDDEWIDLQNEIFAVIERRFGFVAARLGGRISSADLIAALQKPKRVLAVDLDHFSLNPPSEETSKRGGEIALALPEEVDSWQSGERRGMEHDPTGPLDERILGARLLCIKREHLLLEQA